MTLLPAILVEDLSKTYRIYSHPFARVREAVPWRRRPHHRAVHALRDCSLAIAPGECFGLVGANGAGKSTLLKILTGTTLPDTGRYSIHGRVASLLELGAGFTMDFTGRENVFMNGAVLGLTRREMKDRFARILAFSELEHFIDAPLRTYSSGMACRLGFSVAVATEPDVLILDEVLAVGDLHFQRKCMDHIARFSARGKTLLLCSHSLYDVRHICQRAAWIDQGRVRMVGDSTTVTNAYAADQDHPGSTDEDLSLDAVDPAGAGGAKLPHVDSAYLVDPATDAPRSSFEPGATAGVRIHVRNSHIPADISVAVVVTRMDRTILFAAFTHMDEVALDIPHEAVVTLVLPGLKLGQGEYVVTCGVMDRHGVQRFHHIPTRENLRVTARRGGSRGLIDHAHEWRIARNGS